MIPDGGSCPACGETDGIRYASEDGLFRMYCAKFGHSTDRYLDLEEAQQEWRESLHIDPVSGEAALI